MRKNKSTLILGIGIVLLLVFLFAYPRMKSGNGSGDSSVVPCLLPNTPLLQHIHPRLTILVDDAPEIVPADIGLSGCEQALHTHDETGEIHAEAQDRREYTFGDFMGVWEKSFEREGYSLKATVDGKEIVNPAGIVLKDGEQIVLEYTTSKGE
ncbi:hypothetical protein A2116_01335 [Candidatus Jorgensenbacteria bacterium GWA1_49_17]|uniref:DUF4430 domain-containing protein n=1 Tax=Candidatus Jorgensenbacteria bacterium GWA1_49_17 TaxID=1798467 RepID=A0A1F6BUX3_9BACT|nr:MAG: hypothetical protein A2116_01335 [Candidatus Jorgensenbacteria bacterium GWA1_49_17]